jgi:TRAP transporter 4TM/12TM fusion protein
VVVFDQTLTHVDKLLKVSLALFVLWNAFNPLPMFQEAAIFTVLILLCFFMHLIVNQPDSWLERGFHFLMMIGSAVVFGYVVLDHREIMFFVGFAPEYTLYLGYSAVVILLYSCYRALGIGMTLLIALSLLYGFYGHHLPARLGGHPYFSSERLIGTIYLSTNGIFGTVLYTLLKYVFLFILFGKLLEKLGALDFIINLVQSMVGRYRGGAAMVSCVSSGLIGSINGSAVANVMVTGCISIPMMKKLGFKPEFAAGVEASASSGGQFLPPIMAATAFLIAANLGVAYLEVATAALIPAILYFASVAISIYVYSIKHNIKGTDPAELPKFAKVIHDPAGITFFTGFIILVTMLISGFSPVYSVLWALAGIILVSSFNSKSRLTPKKAIDVLADTSNDFLSIGIAGANIGILVSMLLISGMVLRFSSILIDLLGGNLAYILMATTILSIVIGFGLPTLVTYIILAVMAVPVLIELGVHPMAAHLFVFLNGVLAMVTPPVALASLAASSIAKSDFWASSIAALKLAMPALVLPYFFVYNTSLLMMGSVQSILSATGIAFVGVVSMAVALTGSVQSVLEFVKRGILFVAALLLIPNEWAFTIVGLVLAVVVLSIETYSIWRLYLSKQIAASP